MLRVIRTSIWPTATIVEQAASIASAVRLAPLSMRGLTATTGTIDGEHRQQQAELARRKPMHDAGASQRLRADASGPAPDSALGPVCRLRTGVGAAGIGHGVEHALLGRLGRAAARR